MPDLATRMIPDALGMSCALFARACVRAGVCSAPVAMEKYARFHRVGVMDLDAVSAHAGPVVRTHVSESPEGAVLKFCQRVRVGDKPVAGGAEHLETESVLIPMVGKKRVRSYTLCVSSQVGCAMGCAFCQTAQMGLVRSLTPAEITGQLWAARHLVQRPDPLAPIRNIVFMGMGEPMDNLPSVVRAIRVMTDNRGGEIAMSRVTISTVGRVDGITRLAQRVREPGWHRLNLAISLNAPSDAVRSSIMPINRAVPMAELRRALLDWPFFGNAHLCVEYVLIPGVNDAPEHVEQLVSFMQGDGYAGPAEVRRFDGPKIQGIINLIPYNPRDNSPWPAPSEERIEWWVSALTDRGIYTKRRRTKGRDTMAACGQLGNPAVRRASRAVNLSVRGV